jgi:quinoprotein glucose dehydrogenase
MILSVIRPQRALLVAAVLLAACAPPSSAPGRADAYTTWKTYEGDPGASHYSALREIDRSNVSRLQVAWTYDIGDNNAMGMSPVIVDSTMYVVGRNGAVVALDAATGRERWNHAFTDPLGFQRNRGLLYWESPDRAERRIYIPRGNTLYAIDAMSGQTVASFGTAGTIDTREGIDRPRDLISASPNSPGTVFENLLILGSGPGEAYGSGPGDIRAYDARTGRLAWVFHTLPHPGEFGYESWKDPNAWKTGGAANNWGGMAVDVKRGIVYIPLGSASYDFYGADRLGNDLFANSLVALDARTGKRLWHYQTVHHDLWDYDLVSTPQLLTVKHDGKMVDVVAQAGKTGFVYVFDRVTGQPIWPIEERAVPASTMPGEVSSPTQPFPTRPAPFAAQKFTPEDVNPYLPQAERDSLMRYVASMNNKGLFTPPSTTPTMQTPGNAGGANWGSAGVDPSSGMLFVLAKNEPTVLKLEPILPGVFGTGTNQVDRGQFTYQQNCQTCHQPGRQGQPPAIPSLVGVTDRLTAAQITTVVHEGRGLMPAFRDLSNQEVTGIIAYLRNPELAAPPAPAGAPAGVASRYQTGYGYFTSSLGWAIKPPWVLMTAYDLNTGDMKWQVPVGQLDAAVARGIAPTGSTSLRGGPAITAGGLVFMPADKLMLAFDKDTGKQLWSATLPGNVEGIPAVYRAGGRQFVVVGAGSGPRGQGFGGGGAPQGAPAGPPRSYVAFALPR